MRNRLIIIAGPTAVGKTNISISLAKAVNGEIISADSMQVYKGMDIGTAKIRKDEMQGVPHHMIDILEPSDEFNVVTFADKAKTLVEEINKRGHIPIVVGGTGFYIQALLYDIDFTENDDDVTYRNELSALANEKGNEYVHDMLKEVDRESAEKIHPNNIKRVIRALEFYKKSHMCISVHNKEQSQKTSPYVYRYFALTNTRDVIYDRIEKRIDEMVEEGLVDEVKGLMESGARRDYVSMQGLGYKEIAAFIDGECSLEEAVDTLKKGTRHFAKRQITWLKRENDVIWLDKSEMSEDEILSEMIKQVKETEQELLC